MKRDTRKNRREEPEVPQHKVERVVVSSPLKHKNLQSTLDFNWPEFTKETDRIRAYSSRYADLSIYEAMTGTKQTEEISVPEIPVAPVLGGIYKAYLTKHGDRVVISGISAKEQVVCRNNLARFTHMDVENRPIDAKVVSIDKVRQSITIDILQPMFENWVNKIVEDKTVQYDVKAPRIVAVHNLRLSNGGFLGKAEIPVISELVGEPYYIDAFIPGSQIVLNIENDFSKWNGQTVDTFVAGYTTKPGTVNQMSLICSRKALLNFSGNLFKIDLYNDYCSNNKKWKTFTKSQFTGIITGVINTSKKCGVFVELPLFNITGMINVSADKLVEYKAGEEINVRITDFEPMLEYDPSTGNVIHQEPYKIENGCLKHCILKPVFELA
jgi:hypothetical protein